MTVDTKKHNYRIGTISKLAGIPVPTLRVWESRYAAFSPVKTDGQHRMYAEEDLLRATLLKQLSDAGHAISTIANLNVQELNLLYRKHQNAVTTSAEGRSSTQVGTITVVGLGLAGRIESKKFSPHLSGCHLQVADIYADLEVAKTNTFSAPTEILLIKVNTLHEIVIRDIKEIISKNSVSQVIVLYNFGRDQVAQAMRGAGMIVRREPISDFDLAEVLQPVRKIKAAPAQPDPVLGSVIPPRKYSDETLGRVANISTNVLCECPRHVAELITQLSSFEQYSQECLNNSSEDSQLHNYLASVSGTARALFEQALEKVAQHEGIKL